MRVSWRNFSDNLDEFPHEHIFTAGNRHEGKTPHEFIVHLIRKTAAVGVAINGCQIWKSSDTMSDAENIATKALIGEPRSAQMVMVIDYNVQDDWIDNECRTCSLMYGNHASLCTSQDAIDKGWLDMLASVDGR